MNEWIYFHDNPVCIPYWYDRMIYDFGMNKMLYFQDNPVYLNDMTGWYTYI